MENRRTILERIRSGEISPEEGNQKLEFLLSEERKEKLDRLKTALSDVLTSEGLDNLILIVHNRKLITYISEHLKDGYINQFETYDYTDRLKLAEFALFQIGVEFIEQFYELEYKLDENEVIEAWIHNVTPDLIKKLENLGFSRVSFRTLVELCIHSIDLGIVGILNNHGYERPTLRKLIDCSIHGVDKEFIKGYFDLQYKPTVQQLIDLAIHVGESSEIRPLIDAGYSPSIPNLVAMAIHGVGLALLNRLEEKKGHKVSISNAISYAIMGDR